MMTLTAAVKAGVVCMSLFSPEVLVCNLPSTKTILVCQSDGCRTLRELYRSWHGDPAKQQAFYYKLYGYNPEGK